MFEALLLVFISLCANVRQPKMLYSLSTGISTNSNYLKTNIISRKFRIQIYTFYSYANNIFRLLQGQKNGKFTLVAQTRVKITFVT